MGLSLARFALSALTLGMVAFLPALALGEDDPDEPTEEGGDPGEEGVEAEVEQDSPAVYESFRKEVRPYPADEELESWQRYLKKYPQTTFRSDIERRMGELKIKIDKEFDEDVAEEQKAKNQVDARSNELPFIEPFRFRNGNPRKRLWGGIFYGATSYLNFDLGVEWALRREISIFGHLANHDVGSGILLEGGARMAFVKDVRTGTLLSGTVMFRFGGDRGLYETPHLDVGGTALLHFGIAPPEKPIQIQVQVGGDFRFTPLEPRLVFGLNLGIRPKAESSFILFAETNGKMAIASHLSSVTGEDKTTIETFFEASVGGKFSVDAKRKTEMTVALSAPYYWQYWQNYFPLGGGVYFSYHM